MSIHFKNLLLYELKTHQDINFKIVNLKKKNDTIHTKAKKKQKHEQLKFLKLLSFLVFLIEASAQDNIEQTIYSKVKK